MAGDPRAELRVLRASWEYAYANAHSCSWGTDPRLAWVHRRERDLLALIDETAEAADGR